MPIKTSFILVFSMIFSCSGDSPLVAHRVTVLQNTTSSNPAPMSARNSDLDSVLPNNGAVVLPQPSCTVQAGHVDLLRGGDGNGAEYEVFVVGKRRRVVDNSGSGTGRGKGEAACLRNSDMGLRSFGHGTGKSSFLGSSPCLVASR